MSDRCLYPSYAEDLDVLEHPNAFTSGFDVVDPPMPIAGGPDENIDPPLFPPVPTNLTKDPGEAVFEPDWLAESIDHFLQLEHEFEDDLMTDSELHGFPRK